MGGRASFLSATLGLGLAGVIGFYGPVTGPGRAGMPAPAEVADRIGSPVLGLFGGDDGSIPDAAIEIFDVALAEARVEHELIVYPGAPHSFFDRKSDEFAETSTKAWTATIAFVRAHTAAAASA